MFRLSSSSSRASDNESLDRLTLTFSRKELDSYTVLRTEGLSNKSINWLRKSAALLWKYTNGDVSKASIELLRSYTLTKYIDVYARRKVINFAKAFLRYLSKTRFDPRYQSFDLFLELPKGLKERKHITTRIVTKADIENVLRAIEQAHVNEELSSQLYHNYRATVLFGAYGSKAACNYCETHSRAISRSVENVKKPVLISRQIVTRLRCNTIVRFIRKS